MGKSIEFICLGKPLLLVYEKLPNSEVVYPMVCLDKTSTKIVPFEKGNFDNLQAMLDHVCWILTSTQIKVFLKSLESATMKGMEELR